MALRTFLFPSPFILESPQLFQVTHSQGIAKDGREKESTQYLGPSASRSWARILVTPPITSLDLRRRTWPSEASGSSCHMKVRMGLIDSTVIERVKRNNA